MRLCVPKDLREKLKNVPKTGRKKSVPKISTSQPVYNVGVMSAIYNYCVPKNCYLAYVKMTHAWQR